MKSKEEQILESLPNTKFYGFDVNKYNKNKDKSTNTNALGLIILPLVPWVLFLYWMYG
jgi:hypothetical protein